MSARSVDDVTLALEQQRFDEVLPGRASFSSMEVTQQTAARRLTLEKAWQRQAWQHYDQLGEVHYALNIGGNIASRCDLVPMRRQADGRKRVDTTNPEVMRVVEPLAYSDALNRLTWLNMQAPGEMLLTVGKDRHGLWEADVFSNFELNQKSNGVWFRWRGDEELQWQDDLPPTTAVYRIWRPKPRLRDAPDSPLRSVETECKELVLLKLSIMARITSRLVSQGILFIPNNIELAGGAPQVEGLKNDSLGQVLYQMFTAMLANPGSSASAMPILLRGDPDAGEKIRHVVLETDIAETEMRYRQELRDAIANGIELPQQTQTTTQSEVHHWGMWAIDERALSGHVVPVIRMLTHEFTVNLLWPSLRATGMSEREVRLWEIGVDPTRAALAANQTDQAMQLYEHGLIGGDIVRRAFGFSEADAMVGNELLRWIGVKVNNPMLSSWGIDGFPAEMLDQAPKGPGPGGFNAAPPKANGSQQVGSQAKGLDGS